MYTYYIIYMIYTYTYSIFIHINIYIQYVGTHDRRVGCRSVRAYVEARKGKG